MGTWPTNKKEFWWEQEWRHRGDLDLSRCWDRIIWLAPEAEHDQFRALVSADSHLSTVPSPVCLDPSWGMEQIVARLCGFPDEDVTLFHASAGHHEAEDLATVLQSALS